MKNRFLYFFLFSLCFTFLVSCNDDEDTSIQFYTSSQKVTVVYVSNVAEMPVDVRNIKKSYTAKSNDETVAMAVISENGAMTIKGVKEGKTSITVTDSENRSATLNVEVTTETLFLSIIKHETSVTALNSTAEDQPEIDKIKNEIIGKLAPVGGGFKLVYTSRNTGTLIYYADTKSLTEKVDGTFEFVRNEVSQKAFLKFYYSNTEHIYNFGVASSFRFFFYVDYTDTYSQMTKPKITKAMGGLLVEPVNNF